MVLNCLFLVVTRLRRVEAFQEVVIFASNISVGYIFVSLAMLAVAPQSLVLGAMSICVPHGFLAQFDPTLLSLVACFGAGCLMYTFLTMSVMLMFRYNVTCKTSSMSSIFNQKNIFLFLVLSVIFSFIEFVLLHHSVVDPNHVLERLNQSKELTNRLELDIVEFGGRSSAVSRIIGQHNSSLYQEMHNDTASSVQVVQVVHGASNSTGAAIVNYNNVMAGRLTVGVFGFDYTRNPIFFLSLSIFTATNVLCSIIVLIVPLVIACKLRGNQTSMSDKSKEEHLKLTKLLIVNAYLPVILVAVPAINYFTSLVQKQSMPFQEFLGMFCIAPIPVIFPITFMLLIPELRQTTLQLIFCTMWAHRRKANQQKAAEKANQNNGRKI
uniref:G protein-coupled receptor n=1 Tax=Ditylenchus dipsaci TaxID=166011 RepID=A0A915DQM9_9BILA